MERKAGHSHRNPSGSSCSIPTQTMPQNEYTLKGATPKYCWASMLRRPCRGPRSRIQPLTSSTAGMMTGTTANSSAAHRMEQSVRSTSQARNPLSSSTRVAVVAA
jgi:hypothetical protein